MTQRSLSYIAVTKGNFWGHVLRRLIHVCMGFVPIIYYQFSPPPFFVLPITFALLIVFEWLRIRYRWLIIGQRDHERHHISSVAWGGLAIIVVLAFSSQPGWSVAIILSCALGDPVLGESRLRWPTWLAECLGLIVIAVVWVICSFYYQLPVWIAAICVPITVLAEYVHIPNVDDNAVMMFAPLLVIELFCFIDIL